MTRGHVPIRICKGCGRKASQQDLRRFVIVDGIVQEDTLRNMAGRGAYCCNNPTCRDRFIKNTKMLRRAFRLQL